MNYLNRLLAAFCVALSPFIVAEARADNAQVLATCGTANYGAAGMNALTMDQTGLLCASVVASLTFPTIGAAVPATGIYNGINVGGTLRGWSGLSTGALFPGAVAIVDASGNQITSFGATGSTSNASSAVATSSTNVPTVSYNYGFNGTTWDQLQVDGNKSLKIVGGAISHASTTALGTSLVAKASAGNLYGYNCTSVAGGSAGFCIAYNGTAAPSPGALTGSLVLDFCWHDTTARGCSLSRIPLSIAYSTGIVILETSAATPYTYTTGTNTAAISADYQ